jgi:GNAT superfamily N-acetyltransferase
MTWTVLEAPHAESVDDVESWAYRGCADVDRQVAIDDLGDADGVPDAHDIVVTMNERRHHRRRRVVAVDDDGGWRRVVGHGFLIADLQDNLDLAEVRVAVLPDYRRRGIGTALLARVRALAAEEGRSVLMAEVDMAREPDADAPDVLVAPTGNGRVLATDPGVAFARATGFDLRLVARRSLLELPADDDVVARLEAEALAAAGTGYRLHTWHGDLPDRWFADYAALEHRLTVDEPNPGLDLEPEVWDADRVRVTLENLARQHRGYVMTAAEHVATGRLVAATLLEHRAGAPEYAEQETTVVLPEHRGHHLGMLVKLVNLREHVRRHPGTRRIWTWNNEDNPHMLAINVAMGFRPAGGAALFQTASPPRGGDGAGT